MVRISRMDLLRRGISDEFRGDFQEDVGSVLPDVEIGVGEFLNEDGDASLWHHPAAGECFEGLEVAGVTWITNYHKELGKSVVSGLDQTCNRSRGGLRSAVVVCEAQELWECWRGMLAHELEEVRSCVCELCIVVVQNLSRESDK